MIYTEHLIIMLNLYVILNFEKNFYFMTGTFFHFQPWKCLISGWGNTDEGKVSPTLQMATVDYIDEESVRQVTSYNKRVKPFSAKTGSSQAGTLKTVMLSAPAMLKEE